MTRDEEAKNDFMLWRDQQLFGESYVGTDGKRIDPREIELVYATEDEPITDSRIKP